MLSYLELRQMNRNIFCKQLCHIKRDDSFKGNSLISNYKIKWNEEFIFSHGKANSCRFATKLYGSKTKEISRKFILNSLSRGKNRIRNWSRGTTLSDLSSILEMQKIFKPKTYLLNVILILHLLSILEPLGYTLVWRKKQWQNDSNQRKI